MLVVSPVSDGCFPREDDVDFGGFLGTVLDELDDLTRELETELDLRTIRGLSVLVTDELWRCTWFAGRALAANEDRPEGGSVVC